MNDTNPYLYALYMVFGLALWLFGGTTDNARPENKAVMFAGAASFGVSLLASWMANDHLIERYPWMADVCRGLLVAAASANIIALADRKGRSSWWEYWHTGERVGLNGGYIVSAGIWFVFSINFLRGLL